MELEDLKEHIDTRVDGLEKRMDEKFQATSKVCEERCGNLKEGQGETKTTLGRIEKKVDVANGRSRRNSLHITGLWAVLGAGWTVFVLWIKAKMTGS